jgi:hypothetical protein
MRPELKLHCHACVAVEGPDGILLTDPWLFGDVFNGGWSLRPEPDLEALDLSRVRHVWLSHEHPDHLHVPSLRLIRSRVSGPLTAYYGRRDGSMVRDTLTALGYDVVPLVPYRETALADGVSGTLFTAGDDSTLVLRVGDRIVVNQNDCPLGADDVARLTRMFPRVDAWLFQFSLGGYCANPDDRAGLAAARRRQLDLIARYGAAIRPATFVPFASFFYFSKRANAFLNAWAVTPADVMDALPDLPTQILCPGDALLWEGWRARNPANLLRWRAIQESPMPIKPHAAVEEAALLAAGRSLVAAVAACGAAAHGPGETHLEIDETGRAVAIDCRRGRAGLVARADPRRLAIRAPAEELLYFLGSPHGASLFYSSCFRVVNPRRWNRLRRFRHALTAGTAGRLGPALRTRLDRIDRTYLRGTLRGWYRRLKYR